MAPTIEAMVNREFLGAHHLVQQILEEINGGMWGGCFSISDMWVKIDETSRRPDDMEGYVLDRLSSWQCVKWGDDAYWTVDGTERRVATLYVTDLGFQLQKALTEATRDK
ncbi:hypothetical protein ACFQ1S_09665 [Kibdelosporangium lantanae]|uniref:Uncharacterized protein n=1 Tax=Kibdelosporangium lantanae TaxID=1497396 RepID=A0ABW3M686_9PSEU